ncbi:MAG: lytic transglycosylase domain-containing protein [Xanthomonadales bacterium]|nr:lytic transglycosylase domain-containing protein [Gammaproteobacteria bacterium]MBT8051902.1 lytic transglycosylase domain-containing protein [Gammaproteobacteria bacterium]MBT8055328.1 lytic transglycosylase domain-containing protein [Gammaproteobacteria bacterium]NNJ78064.1 lytic transglycosylase domain-containing protein [Xanthomonadales bacterium]NNL05499.1 lytic transglycosylase domain-containing protein [Xanthomonadales bacterium]
MKNSVRLIAGSILVVGLLPGLALAQVYKWVDENGIINYSNTAPPTDRDFAVLNFPCYASDPKCRSVAWEKVPLNTRSFAGVIREASVSNAVDESLIRAIIHAESAYQVEAQSPKGAQGLMQLMPDTQAELDVGDPFDPAENIRGGARYLAQLLTEFDGDVELAAAAYNAGPSAVNRYGGVPPFEETREYVRRIRILHRRYAQAL